MLLRRNCSGREISLRKHRGKNFEAAKSIMEGDCKLQHSSTEEGLHMYSVRSLFRDRYCIALHCLT